MSAGETGRKPGPETGDEIEDVTAIETAETGTEADDDFDEADDEAVAPAEGDIAEDEAEAEDEDEDDDFEDEDDADDGPHAAPAAPTGPTRCGFVALIGAPNAGKSTLTNALVGTKVSIVSHKVQTTRAIVRGIVIHGAAQMVLVDTPGIFPPKRRLERAMVSTAWTSAADADLVALLVDARRGLDADIEALLQPLSQVRRPRALILNKIDLIRRDTLLALTTELTQRLAFDRVFMISALTGDGVEDLKHWIAGTVQEGPWLYPEDQITDAPMRMLAAEVTREKLFVRLHDELPYRSTVETESWKELRDGSVRIEQTIYVERDSQRKIVLGRGGSTIKAISTEARAEIAEITEQRIHLFIFVKVRENWSDDPERYREMGLDFPRE
ncbi:MAG: GTPase Era [Rhizobiales bacterium 35-68-8]|nr:MAG: GTPase Era [Rhizobiales bacterium 35-68-8]